MEGDDGKGYGGRWRTKDEEENEGKGCGGRREQRIWRVLG